MTSFLYSFESVEQIDGCAVINQDVHRDERGGLWTLWDEDIEELNDFKFNLDKVSVSKKNVFRGLHGDEKSTKLVSVLLGEVFFVLYDDREFSRTYQNSLSVTLVPGKFYLIPPGVCNGYWVKSEEAVFWYKWSFSGRYVDANDQKTIKWTDPRLSNICWPNATPILSERDS